MNVATHGDGSTMPQRKTIHNGTWCPQNGNVNENCQYKGQLTSQKKWTTNIVQEKQDNRYQPLQPENESWRALISKLRPVAK